VMVGTCEVGGGGDSSFYSIVSCTDVLFDGLFMLLIV